MNANDETLGTVRKRGRELYFSEIKNSLIYNSKDIIINKEIKNKEKKIVIRPKSRSCCCLFCV